jgi:hypothetical protein
LPIPLCCKTLSGIFYLEITDVLLAAVGYLRKIFLPILNDLNLFCAATIKIRAGRGNACAIMSSLAMCVDSHVSNACCFEHVI